MAVFVDNRPILDNDGLSDPVQPNSEVYVMQALSGGIVSKQHESRLRTTISDRIHVATRKGLITVDRKNGRWSVTRLDFEGSNCNLVLADPRDGAVYAALDHEHFGVKLHRSVDGGVTWTERGVPVYPEFTAEDEQKQEAAGEVGARRDFSSLSEIWELTPGGADQPGVLWAGTIPGGLFRSDDYGSSWQLIETLWRRDERWAWFGGGKDSPGIHSVAVHPANSQHVAVGISCGGVWVTEDGGTTWNVRAQGMYAEFLPPDEANDPNVQDPHRVVQCRFAPHVMWAQYHNGIFRTTDGGRIWNEVTNVQPS